MKRIVAVLFSVIGALLFLVGGEAPAFAVPETPIIPYCQHVWGAPSYTWSEDHATCTARSLCVKNKAHTLTETAQSVCLGETKAGCETEGTLQFSASFEKENFLTQTVTVVTEPAAGHDWGAPEYIWSADHLSCTGRRVCSRSSDHVLEETVETRANVTGFASAGEDGVLTYVASFSDSDLPASSRDVPFSRFDVLWGDVNGDGEINNKDVVRLKNYFAAYDDQTGISGVSVYSGADANGDGALSNKDVVRLKNYLANYDDITQSSEVTLGPASMDPAPLAGGGTPANS